jgi:uncharacterized protein YndB with AHSA1/START domain
MGRHGLHRAHVAYSDKSRERKEATVATGVGTTVRYEARTTIDTPIGEVFARLADLDGYATWMHRTGLFRRSGQTSDGALGRGTAYFDATRMGTYRGEVIEFERPSRIGFQEMLRWFDSAVAEARTEYFLEVDRREDDRSSRRGRRALRLDATDEASRGAPGKKRTREDAEVVETFTRVGLAASDSDSTAAGCSDGPRAPRVASDG